MTGTIPILLWALFTTAACYLISRGLAYRAHRVAQQEQADLLAAWSDRQLLQRVYEFWEPENAPSVYRVADGDLLWCHISGEASPCADSLILMTGGRCPTEES